MNAVSLFAKLTVRRQSVAERAQRKKSSLLTRAIKFINLPASQTHTRRSRCGGSGPKRGDTRHGLGPADSAGLAGSHPAALPDSGGEVVNLWGNASYFVVRRRELIAMSNP